MDTSSSIWSIDRSFCCLRLHFLPVCVAMTQAFVATTDPHHTHHAASSSPEHEVHLTCTAARIGRLVPIHQAAQLAGTRHGGGRRRRQLLGANQDRRSCARVTSSARDDLDPSSPSTLVLAS